MPEAQRPARDRWEEESVRFDRLYAGAWETRVPFLGRIVHQGLVEREERAFAVAGPLAGRTVLDLGCGVGRFALRAASRGAVVHGYDISEPALEIARQRAREADLAGRYQVHHGDLRSTEFPRADFWCDLGTLQYLSEADVGSILERLRHVERFFSALPRRGHPLDLVRRLYRGLLKGNPYHTWSQASVRALFAPLGEVVLEPRGMALHVHKKTPAG